MEDDDAADAADDGETFLVELTTWLQLLRKMPERSIWGLFARVLYLFGLLRLAKLELSLSMQ